MERLAPTIEGSDQNPFLHRLTQLEAENEDLAKKIEKLTAENERLKEELKKHERDELTGLMRLKEFSILLEDRLRNLKVYSEMGTDRKERFGYTTMAVLYFDLDGFKKMNDTYGHAAGNEILKEVSAIVQERLRSTDSVCRYGGDEFVVNLLGTDEDDALWTAGDLRDTVRNKIRERFGEKYPEAPISLSVGVRVARKDDLGTSPEELIKDADAAMFAAKKTKDAIYSFSRLENENKNS